MEGSTSHFWIYLSCQACDRVVGNVLLVTLLHVRAIIKHAHQMLSIQVVIGTKSPDKNVNEFFLPIWIAVSIWRVTLRCWRDVEFVIIVSSTTLSFNVISVDSW